VFRSSDGPRIVPNWVVFTSWEKYPGHALTDENGLGEDYVVKQYLQLHGARPPPLGVIYDADLSGKSDASWTRNVVSNFARVETGVGVHTDHAVIETWVRYPTRMLPENEPGRFTNVVLQYIQKHPQ
jgi:hypothetical protein